jgi:formate/nitrite transporter FocA (FNT family)
MPERTPGRRAPPDRNHAEEAREPDANSASLREEEKEHAAERATPGAQVVHEAIRLEGQEELERPTSALAWSAVAAGLSIGFSLVAEAILKSSLPDAAWRPLVTKLGYPVGFLFVVLGRQQLFTENTLTPILPLLDRPSWGTLANVGRLWGAVLAGNVVGAYAFAWLVTRAPAMGPDVQAAFREIAHAVVAPSFGAIFVRAVFGGWLIALMVWVLPGADNARFLVIVVVTWLVGVGEFSHSIASAPAVFVLVVDGELSLLGHAVRWLLPSILGNTIGGVALVAALNHAQVAATLKERRNGDG